MSRIRGGARFFFACQTTQLTVNIRDMSNPTHTRSKTCNCQSCVTLRRARSLGGKRGSRDDKRRAGKKGFQAMIRKKITEAQGGAK